MTLHITDNALRSLYSEWEDGRTKVDIEREDLLDLTSHGKTITRLWRDRLGIETEGVHPLVIENRRLRKLVAELGALVR